MAIRLKNGRFSWGPRATGCLFIYLKNLFILKNFWQHWVFVAVHGLSLVAASGGYSSLQCTGFLLWWLPLLQSTGSRAQAQ